MSYLLDKAFQIAMMIIFLLLFVVLVAVGVIIMNRAKRKNRKEEDIYYQDLNRYDAQDFLEFDDITDGMVITNGHRRFVGAIKCIGYDFYSASGIQQESTINGFMEFIRTLTMPVTFRQYFVRMYMDHTMNMYRKRYDEIEAELFHKAKDREVLVERLNSVRNTDIVAEEDFLERIEKLQEEMSNLSWRREHLMDQMRFLDVVSDKDVMDPDIEQVYLFEWEFLPDRYSVEFTEEEIHEKAIVELRGIEGRLRTALSGANVRSYRCSTEELIEMFQHQSHPLSSMEFKMPDVADSPYFDFVTTTNDIDERKTAVYEDLMISEAVRMANTFDENLYKIQMAGGKKE